MPEPGTGHRPLYYATLCGSDSSTAALLSSHPSVGGEVSSDRSRADSGLRKNGGLLRSNAAG